MTTSQRHEEHNTEKKEVGGLRFYLKQHGQEMTPGYFIANPILLCIHPTT
jgi:hypothetical protein